MLNAEHCLQSMAVRVDGELHGRCFRDPTHRAAEQICQATSLAVAYWLHDDIQESLRSHTARIRRKRFVSEFQLILPELKDGGWCV